MRSFSQKDLVWNGHELRLGTKRGRLLATIVLDRKWPKMYRIQLPGQDLSDMVNLTRAKDAAIALAIADLNQRRAA